MAFHGRRAASGARVAPGDRCCQLHGCSSGTDPWVAVGSCQSIEYFFKYLPNINLFFLQKGSVILHGGRGKDFSVFVGKEPLKTSTLYTVRKMGKLWVT